MSSLKKINTMVSSETKNKLVDTSKGPIVLFTNARDEKNIKEWAIHHLLLGFDYICIFDHKSKIPIKNIFFGHDRRIKIEKCVMNDAPKMPLMNIALKKARSINASWFIYLDADEFIVLPKYDSVRSFLSQYSSRDAVLLNWLMFGTNNLFKEPKGLIIENYTKSCSKLDKHIKMFVRPFAAKYADNPHFYHVVNNNKVCDIKKGVVREPLWNVDVNISFNQAPAFIAHYVNQSEETYRNRKINIPRDDTNEFRAFDPDIHKRYNNTENIVVKNLYSKRVRDYLINKQREITNRNTISHVFLKYTTILFRFPK
jgi:hypothetical protein